MLNFAAEIRNDALFDLLKHNVTDNDKVITHNHN